MPSTIVQDREHSRIIGETGDDTHAFTVPPGEIFVGATLTITKSDGGGGARMSAPPQGATGTVSVTVHWWHDTSFPNGGDVAYHLVMQSDVPGTTAIEKLVPGASAATVGFHFDNRFPIHASPLITFSVGGHPQATLGDASNGLCGGMVYAARDFFETRTAMPPDTTPPTSGPLFDMLVSRLVDSFDLPTGPAKYMWLMDPALPDHETTGSQILNLPHGRSFLMLTQEWPAIRAEIDSGKTSCMALVRVKTLDPSQLGVNHQVLCWGYTISGQTVTLHLYDPDHHGSDTHLSFDATDPAHSIVLSYSAGDTFFSFFRTPYTAKMPTLAPTTAKPGLVILFSDRDFMGRSRMVDSVEPNLAVIAGGEMNDQTSSIIIARGTWRFFKDAAFAQPYLGADGRPLELGPGLYNFVEDVGIQNDSLSSLMCIG